MTNGGRASDSLFRQFRPAAHLLLRAENGLEFFLTHAGDDALVHGIACLGAAGGFQHAAQHFVGCLWWDWSGAGEDGAVLKLFQGVIHEVFAALGVAEANLFEIIHKRTRTRMNAMLHHGFNGGALRIAKIHIADELEGVAFGGGFILVILKLKQNA